MTFAAIPTVPSDSGLTDFERRFLTTLKQNVELLTGQRGDGTYAALLKGQLNINSAPSMTLQQITALGAGVTISGYDVPLLSDYVKLITDLATLANDVAAIKNTLNGLITQLNT